MFCEASSIIPLQLMFIRVFSFTMGSSDNSSGTIFTNLAFWHQTARNLGLTQ